MSSNNNDKGQSRQQRIANEFNTLLTSRATASPSGHSSTPTNTNNPQLGDPHSRPLLKSTPTRPLPGARATAGRTMSRFTQQRGPPPHPQSHPSRLNIARNTVGTPINPWQGMRELKLDISNIPGHWTTWEVYNVFSKAGNIHRVHMHPLRTDGTVNAFVIYRPPPQNVEFIRTGRISLDNKKYSRQIRYQEARFQQEERQYESPDDPRQKFAEKTTLRLHDVEIGTMKTPSEFLALHTITEEKAVPVSWSINLWNKVKMELEFLFQGHKYRIDMLFTELEVVSCGVDAQGHETFLIHLNAPPLVYRQPREPKSLEATHQDGNGDWNESMTWFRQLKIVDIRASNQGQDDVTQLKPIDTMLDVSRWLTYRFVVPSSTSPADLDQFKRVLHAFHASISTNISIRTMNGHSSDMYWATPEPTPQSFVAVKDTSFLTDLEQMAAPSMELAFSTKYQLEVCLSQHILHESNLNPAFVQALAAMDQRRATKLLEKAADSIERFHDPMGVFKLQAKLDKNYKKVPTWCAVMPAATVTPTTIYYHTPALETSNRVIRTFSRIEDGVLMADRFLRVKFTDERYYGRIRAHAATTDLLFAHVKRTMKNGILVGGRHYEFLAYSNSQFRDHGALFFASTPNMTADMVREWMGDFQHIPVVAKYASRLGQCLSTTRAISIRVNIEKIPDINRNGFCFTDGVGKISPFAAQMIAQESGFASSPEECPSVFQVRIGGAKGVLAVDPTLKGSVVALRPSQEKFAARYNGLEVCRISQFSAACLNVQLIPILVDQGSKPDVIMDIARENLSDVELAVTDPKRAVVLMYKNIDYNHMTLVLAQMIEDGFMHAGEPFLMSCLHLWRSDQIRQIKEKFKILIKKGAFVLGCVDETAILKGHFNETGSESADSRPLPEVFIQISEDRASNSGRCEIIEGVCILARNPSLHPGDIRVVRAVNVPALHHLKNCVVLPQTGDRDLGNMCSGGDLDGDDYMLIWDQDLLPDPERWNPEPMDYQALPAKCAEGPITPNDLSNHFVQHMRYDNLSQIAVQHRLRADREPDGVYSKECLELARLHSMAVDYPKTGHPAVLPKSLRVGSRPHWSEPRKNQSSYHSKKILGRIYDEVELVQFSPDWEGKFDERILGACPDLSEETLGAAREVKAEYDENIRRIMAQYEVENEFEVWTTFVQRHTDTMGDYKFAETFGEVVANLKQQFRDICFEAAGTTAKERDWSKIRPFLVAMYKVTADQVNAAVEAARETQIVNGREEPVWTKTFKTTLFMSFPWIFHVELGQIANHKGPISHKRVVGATIHKPAAKKAYPTLPEGDFVLEPLKFMDEKENPVQKGELLDLFHQHAVVKDAQEHKKAFEAMQNVENKSPAMSTTDGRGGTQTEQMMHAMLPGAFPTSPTMVPIVAKQPLPNISDVMKASDTSVNKENALSLVDVEPEAAEGETRTEGGEEYVEREEETAAKKPSTMSRFDKMFGLS